MASGLELLDDLPAPPAWMAEAACKGQDTRDFFPPRGVKPRAAIEVCGRCPVSAQCADYAIENDEHGVWGGLSERQRRRIRAARAA